MAKVTEYLAAEKWARRLRNRHLLVFDIVLLAVSAWLSFAMRLDAEIPARLHTTVLIYAALAVVVRLAALYGLGVYRRYWQYARAGELALIVVAMLISTVAIGVLSVLILKPLDVLDGLPRSVPLIDGLVALMLVGGSRGAMRVLASRPERGARAGALAPALIVGAGEVGGIIAHELEHQPRTGLRAVGFVDDDPCKQGVWVHGLKVLGRSSDLPWLIPKHRAKVVLLAIPSAPGAVIRELREVGARAGAEVRTMPGIHEILAGQVSVRQVRDVQIEDLLRREPVTTDVAGLHANLRQRRVAVTGAGGSIGGELCRQIAAIGPSLLVLIGHGENSIFEIEQELKRVFPAVPLQPVIVDIRDAQRLNWVMSSWRPDVVFHAAAHKHVPMMECNVTEAVTNNVLGTRNVLESAVAAGVERLVMVSSDKAVQPCNVMGLSKRLAELVVQEYARRHGRAYVVVRFGNVLGSRGSVVPLFKQQIKAGGPVTVTAPGMTRYFMTIPEAVHLILQASVMGAGGEVFVLDMGEPVRVLDLARDLIELSGLKPDEDIEIVFTGLRPGEKLHEELFYPDEVSERTAHDKILVTANGHGGGRQDMERVLAHLEYLVREQREVDMLRVCQTAIGALPATLAPLAAAPGDDNGGEWSERSRVATVSTGPQAAA